MRVGEELMVVAVAGAQSGKALPGIPVTLSITKNDDEAIMLEDGMITAEGAGSAEITAESELAGIAGKLTVTVTKPISKIAFMVGSGDDAADGPSDIVLAAGQKYKDEITAVAKDEDGNVIAPRSNWSWSSSDDGVATVAARKDDDDKLVDMGAHGTITGKGAGDADIMATAEGVSGSIGVSVSGQVKTAMIVASLSNNGNTFTWDRGAETPAWDPATTTFQVNLYDIISGDRIIGEVGAVSDDTDVATVGAATVTTTGGSTAAATLTVSPATPAGDNSPGDGTGNDDLAAGSRTAVISLTATGADPVRILITTVVKAAPATN